jgi:hypothetical protein
MNDIKKLKAWQMLKDRGYIVVTYRFNNIITDYGAMLTDKAGAAIVDIKPYSNLRKSRWTVIVDKRVILSVGFFTLNSAFCSSNNILSVIDELIAGKIEVQTRYDPVKGRVPVYSGF